MNINSNNVIHNNDPLDRFIKPCDNYALQQSMLPPEQKMVEYNGAYYEIDGQTGVISIPQYQAAVSSIR